MTVWKIVENEERYAVAIYNFAGGVSSSGVPLLSLDVGELVRIERTSEKWCWGRPARTSRPPGAFPTSYVHFKDIHVEDSELPVCKLYTCGTNVTDDIDITLREWFTHWKQLYLTCEKEKYDFIEESMKALLQFRPQITSGTLPVDQLRKKGTTARFLIDRGNRKLGRELTLRDSNGDLVDPRSYSLHDLNILHEETNDRLEKNKDSSSRPGSTNRVLTRCYSVSVRINVVDIGCSQPAELSVALYDHLGNKLTEHFLMTWTSNSLLSKQILFTELSSEALGLNRSMDGIDPKKVYLVCHVVKVGSIVSANNSNNDSRRSSIASSGNFNTLRKGSPGALKESLGVSTVTGSLREPLGVAAVDITPLLNTTQTDVQKDTLLVPFYPYEREYLDTLLKKIISHRQPKDMKHTAGLSVSVQLLRGDSNQIALESPAELMGVNEFARAIGVPDVLAPGDARNDLHVTLHSGHFTRSGRNSLQLIASVRDSKGNKLDACISRGAGHPLTDIYESVVYYHDDKPRWSETFRVALDVETFKEAHLVVMVRHRSSKEAKDRNEKPFAISYVQLMRPEGTTVPDAMHNLCVYNIEYKRASSPNMDIEREAAALCLGVPWSKEQLDKTFRPMRKEFNFPMGPDQVIKKGVLTLLPKDSLTIQTTLASTKLTQKEEIVYVLKWSACLAEGTLKNALRSLLSVPSDELVKFLHYILDALFAILTQVEEDTLNGENEYEFHDNSYAVLVLDCLLKVFHLLAEHKYQHYQPVLNIYIEHSFSDAVAYERLLRVIRWTILCADRCEERNRTLLCLKSIECLIKIVAKSRQLRASLDPNDKHAEQVFHNDIEAFLTSVCKLMRCSGGDLSCQACVLKYLPLAAALLRHVYAPAKLAQRLVEVLQALSTERLAQNRLLALRTIAKGPLMEHQAARKALLPYIADTIAFMLRNNEAGGSDRTRCVGKAAKLLGADLHDYNQHLNYIKTCMEVAGCVVSLTRKDQSDRRELAVRLLPAALKTCVWATEENEKEKTLTSHQYQDLLRCCICVTLDLVRDTTPEQWEFVTREIRRQGPNELASDALGLFRKVLHKPVFPNDWADMLHMQLLVMAHALKLLSVTLCNRLSLAEESGDSEAVESTLNLWKNWFATCSELCCTTSLQIESLPRSRFCRVHSLYGDIRPPTAKLIVSMWASLGRHKRSLVPWLVVPVLDASFVNNDPTRDTLIPLLYQMMETEYFSRVDVLDESDMPNYDEFRKSAESLTNYQSSNYDDVKETAQSLKDQLELINNQINKDIDKENIQSLISETAGAILDRVDELAESGRGDAEWSAKFVQSCDVRHSPALLNSPVRLRQAAASVSDAVRRQLDALLKYRDAGPHRAQLITELLTFYDSIQRPHLYVRYVHKLAEIHKSNKQWVEAGMTLQLHASLLNWTDDPVPPGLCVKSKELDKFALYSQRYHKEALYISAKDLLGNGKLFAVAVQLVSELVRVYERDARGYGALAGLHLQLAKLYEQMDDKAIVGHIPTYYRVRYFGNSFPDYLRNPDGFVYRGNEMELLPDFQDRILEDYPDATWLQKLDDPSDDIVNSDKKYIQINPVEPVMCEERVKSAIDRGEAVSSQMLQYYKHNHTDTFIFDRPEKRHEKSLSEEKKESFAECATLWVKRTEIKTSYKFPGILCWFPIVSIRSWYLCPLERAIEIVRKSNCTLKQMADDERASQLDPKQLERTLSGIVNAKVQGGVEMYESAFLSPQYTRDHPDHGDLQQQLKDAIAHQLPLLEHALHLHKKTENQELHNLLMKCYHEMKERLQNKYRLQPCSLQHECGEVHLRRDQPDITLWANRLSDVSNSLITDTHTSATSPKISLFTLYSRNSSSNIISGGGAYKTMPNFGRPRRPKSRKNDPQSLNVNGGGGMVTWYTTEEKSTQEPLLKELRQELVTARPLRSEAEKRISIRTSSLFTASSNTSSNRDSIGTTDSNQDEEEPPPLPVKSRHDISSVSLTDVYDNVDCGDGVPKYSYDVVVTKPRSFLHSQLSLDPAALSPPAPPPKNRRNQT